MALAARAAGLGRYHPGCRAATLARRRRGAARGPRGLHRPPASPMRSPGGRSWRTRATGGRVRLDTWHMVHHANSLSARIRSLLAVWRKPSRVPRDTR
jgi:hypothetical protein